MALEQLTAEDLGVMLEFARELPTLKKAFLEMNAMLDGFKLEMDAAKEGGEKKAAADAQMRAYRLLRLENESAQNFAAGFFNRAEPLMDKLASAEATAAEKVDGVVEAGVARISNAKKAVTSLVQLMQDIRSESQSDQESGRALLTEIVAQQKVLAEAQTKAVDTYAELYGKLNADAINDAAAKAAKGLVTGDIKKMIDDEVKRQVRIALKQGG